jgi:hypothetical protein
MRRPQKATVEVPEMNKFLIAGLVLALAGAGVVVASVSRADKARSSADCGACPSMGAGALATGASGGGAPGVCPMSGAQCSPEEKAACAKSGGTCPEGQGRCGECPDAGDEPCSVKHPEFGDCSEHGDCGKKPDCSSCPSQKKTDQP